MPSLRPVDVYRFIALLALVGGLAISLSVPAHAVAGAVVSGITDDEEGADIVVGPDAESREYARTATLDKQMPALFIGKQPKRKTVNFVEFSKLRTSSECPWPMYVTLDVYRYPTGSPRDISSRVRVAEAQFPTLVTNDQETSRWLTQEPLDLQEGESYGFVPTVVGTSWVIDPENEDEVRKRDLCLDAPLRTTTYPAVNPPDPDSPACRRMPLTFPRPDGREFLMYRVWMNLPNEDPSAFRTSEYSDIDDVTAERICRGQETVAQSGGSYWGVVYIDSGSGNIVSVRSVGAARQDVDPTASEEELRQRALARNCYGEERGWEYGIEDLIRGSWFGIGNSGTYEAYAMHKCAWASWPPSDGDPDQGGWFWALPNGPGLPRPDGSRPQDQHQIIDAVLSSITSAPGLTDPRETLGGVNPSAEVPRCNTGDPINCATGNFYEEYTDLALPGRGVGVSVTRTYNAQAAAPDPIGTAPQPGLFGRGWTSEFEAKLLFTGSPDTVVIQQGNGSTVPFSKQGGAWVGPDWARSTLTRNGTTTSAGYVFTLPNRTKYTFHPTTGALLMVADERSNKVLLTWLSGRLTKVTGGNRTLTFSYNASGRVSSISDGTGRSVSYTYSTAQELTSFTDVGGAVWSYAYDLRGRMTRKVDPRGATVENVYDAQDRVTQQTDPLGRITKLEYLGTPAGSKVKVTDRSGVVSMKVFNKGVPISETRGYGTSKAATVRMAHNSRGQLRRLVDANGNATRYRYDERGNRTEIIDALGGVTRTAYDSLDRPTETVTPAGRRTRLTYDAAGNVVSTVRDGTMSGDVDERLFTYDAYGQLLTATNPEGGVTTYAYDAVGNTTSVTSPGGRTTTMAYDSRGGLLTTTLPAGNVSGATPTAHQITYTRDVYGAPLTVKDAMGGTTTYTYDSVANVIGIRDADNELTTFTYDLLHRKTQQVRADGGRDSWTYTPEGDLLTRTDGNGAVWTNAYDDMGRRVSQTDPFSNTTTYEYSPAGELFRVRAPDTSSVGYSYDELGRLRAIFPHGPDRLSAEAPDAHFQYDPDGLVVSASNGNELSLMTWDALGRFTERQYGNGSDGRSNQGHTAIRYDANGNVASIQYPTGVEYPKFGTTRTTASFGRVTYGYGADGEMTSVTGLSGGQYAFTYDANGNLSRATYPGSRSASYTRDAMGRVLTMLTPAGRRTYAYTAAGVRKTVGIDATTNGLLTDGARHLTGYGSKTYTFDAGENPTRMYEGSTSYQQGFLGPRIKWTDTGSEGRFAFQHDEVGRRTRETYSYTQDYNSFRWNELSELRGQTVRGRDGSLIGVDYTYGPTGLRKTVTRDGVVKVEAWEEALGGNAPMLTQGLEAIVYGPGGMLLERVGVNGSNPRYQWQDAIGSVIGATSSTGTTTRLAYDPWGRLTSGNPALAGTHGFAGQVTEPGTDRIFMRARWYDPETGLFLSVDPKVEQTLQPYLYAGGNPVQYTDPSGESFAEDFANGMIQGLSNDQLKLGSNEGSCSWAYFMGLQAGQQFNPLGKAKRLDELLGAARVGRVGLTASEQVEAKIASKLQFVFGKATGNAHNVERSQAMAAELARIGIYDSPEGRRLVQSHLSGVLADSTSIASRDAAGRDVRESLLAGPGGFLKVESVWEGQQLVTVYLKGGKR